MLKPLTCTWKGKVVTVVYEASCHRDVWWNKDIVRHIFISELGGYECLTSSPSDFVLCTHCVVSVNAV